MLKRGFDFVASLLGLIVLSPVIVVLIVAVRATSPGPGVFTQMRVGRHGVPFACHKLRTMAAGTAAVPTHEAAASSITSLGRVMRGTKLDELPQLLNVLRGEMSFVGPRPCLPSQTELIELRRAAGVLEVRPGITGLAQIQGIDMSDPPKLAEVDAAYVRSASFFGDLHILFATVFGAKGQGDRVVR
jgi:O-antigen biosynthesis protein WbqP